MATKRKTGKKAKTTAKTTKKKKAIKARPDKKMAKKGSAAAKTKLAKKVAKKVPKKVAIKAKPAMKRLAQTVTVEMPMAAHGPKILVGANVPDFDLPATGGRQIALQGLKGKQVVLYFYPKDATPGCTLEGHEFTKLHGDFKSLNAEVYGVSRDDVNSHEKFKTKECYSIDLLSDTSGEVCEMFDVIKAKNMYGREVVGIERSTFVIDGEGKLLKEWRGVKAEGHAQQVLEFLKAQQK
jgi:thioredoxin-dependent peroxiredoxin